MNFANSVENLKRSLRRAIKSNKDTVIPPLPEVIATPQPEQLESNQQESLIQATSNILTEATLPELDPIVNNSTSRTRSKNCLSILASYAYDPNSKLNAIIKGMEPVVEPEAFLSDIANQTASKMRLNEKDKKDLMNAVSTRKGWVPGPVERKKLATMISLDNNTTGLDEESIEAIIKYQDL